MSSSKKYLIFIFLFLLSSFSFAQTVHSVSAGDSTLAAAIADAADGDIIELVSDGGLYTNPNQIEIDKSLIIRAHPSLTAKPIVKYIGTSTSAYMFKLIASPKVVFQGIELDGDGTGEGAAALAKYALRLDNADSLGTMDVRIMDCVLHDFTDKIIKPYGLCGIDSLIVHNSTFYNGGSEGVVLYTGSTSDPAVELDYAEFDNCTFYGIAREGIKADTNPNTVMRVNHCTFYDCGGTGKSFIFVDDLLDVEIKNNIFVKNAYGSYFARLEGDSNLFHHNIFYDVASHEVLNGSVAVSDTLFEDPLFADALNGDFTLDLASPALGYADDGFAAGDLRWDPTALFPKVLYVDEGTDVLKPIVDAAAAGDTIEFTTSGGQYLSSDQIVVDKDLVFRARAGLAEMPILKYVGTSTGAYMFKVEASPKVRFYGIEFDGDGTAQGGAALAKYALRLDNGDALGTMDVRIMDCVMHDFTDKIIKPYGSCGIDSLIVHNTIFYNGGSEGVVLYSGSSSDPAVELDYAEFYNCTFYGIVREGIKADTNPNTIMRVNQCTFYDCGGTSKGMIYVDDLLDVEVKNSIFVKNSFGDNFARFESEANLFHHNVVDDVASYNVSNTTATDTVQADPLFADASIGDFSLDAASPARTAGEGGAPAGDLRWAIDPNAVVLSVVTNGQGIVTLDPPGNVYSPGTMVTLTATADLGWEFAGWSGDVNPFPPDQNPTTVTINSNITAVATFENLTPQVTLIIDSIGLGSVVANPEPGDDGTYDQGATVELTAVPAADWEFVEWLGDVTGTDNPVTFNVDSNMVVTASYQSTLTQFALNITVVGNGSFIADPEPIISTYDTNTVVRLTAVPAIGWTFEGWTGDLTSAALLDSVTMDSDKNVTATFLEEQVAGGVLEIDDSWDLMDAVDYANNNSTVTTLKLTTSGGVYTTLKSGTVEVRSPLNIVAADSLTEKPIISNTNPDGAQGTIDILRAFDDLMIKGVIIDGSTTYSAGMKYAVRYANGTAPDTVKWGSNAIFMDVDFRHLYDDANPLGDGHAFKLDKEMILGEVRFEDCTFNDIGYEAIRISDTEKWVTDRCFDSLIVRNCTFTNIDAEGIRYYSDLDPNTPDAPVIIEHVTFNNSATRTMYLKNSGGAIVRDIIIANPRMSGHGRDGDLMDSQGADGGVAPSYVSYIDTFNVNGVLLKAGDGIIDDATIYGIDPEFEDAANLNFTLLETSHLYGLASDGEAIGDLNWATNVTVNKTLDVAVVGDGSYTVDPMPIGNSYNPGTVVSVTAIPDSGYMFVNWTGDITSTENPLSVTLTESVSITANFDFAVGIDEVEIPTTFSISQNYPNPFNPTTTIKFGLPVEAKVSIRIYNSIGQEITRLVNGETLNAGYHQQIWDAKNSNGVSLASGLYIYRIEAVATDGKEFIQTMKMMFLK
jgi:uncharacterized repeat protein (TIGR02543 family)